MDAVFVTGAGSGIGRATALAMARRGLRVYAGVRRPADADALAALGSERLVPLLVDVVDAGAVARAAAAVEASGDALVGVVNNAGVSVGGPLELQPLAEVRQQLEVNVVGAIAVTQAFLPARRRSRGRLVFVGAAAGRVALPFVAAYSASKFAIEGIADALRIELLPFGVHVAVVEPGAIDTPILGKTHLEEAADHGPYREAMAAMAAASAQTHARAIPAEVVAEAIEHALTSASPKTRYPVGVDAKLLSWFARALPDALRDALLAHTIGLGS